MRKTKVFLTVAAAAVFATATAGLVACNDNNDGGEEVGVYAITFDANGGSFATADPVILNTVDGKLAEMPSTNPIRTDFTFSGWNVKADGTGATVNVDTVFTDSVTVYAKWTSNDGGEEEPVGVFDIKFDPNGGELAAGESGTIATLNGRLTAALPKVATRDGFEFVGWNDKQDGTGAPVTVNYLFTETKTVYAKWESTGTEEPSGVYTVTFNPNGGALAAGAVSSMTTTNGKLTGALPEVETRDGFTFGGWNLKSDGSGDTVGTSTVFSAHTEVYAKWTATGGDTDEIGYYIIGGNKVELTYNGKPALDTAEKEYMATGVEVEANAVVSFEIGDEPLEFKMDSRSHGVRYADNTLVARADGTFDIYVRYYGATGTDAAMWTVEMNDGVVEEKAAYYLVDDINGWALDSDHKFAVDTLGADETHLSRKYKLAGVTIAANTRFKIKYNPAEGEKEAWYAGLESDYVDPTIATGGGYGDNAPNITVVTEGTYDIYLKFGTDGIHSIYIGPAGGGDHGGDEEDTGTASFSVGGGEAVSLTNNTANISPEHKAKREFLATGVALNEDDVLTFTVDDSALTAFNLAGESHGVTKVGSGLKVLETGTFDIYVRFYKADNAEPNDRWVIEMTDGKTEEVGELVEGDYYIVGSMNSWSPKEAYHIGADGVTVKLYEGQAFKIAKNKEGGPDWTDAHFTYSNVGVGKGYVETDKDTNICIKETATYTVKINGGKVEITSDEIEEPDVPVVPSTFYLKGTVDGENKWSSEEYNLSEVAATDGAKKQYAVTVTITSSIEFKIYNSANNGWYNNIHGGSEIKPSGTDNKTITGAGTYTFIVQVWNDEGTDCSIRITKDA